ncbi:MAG: hypothetical protein H6587_01045 [Flavobacteriales bacterium]|nr:hypothetical protein [Flavobacteriales bacterium]MCB9363131.1 hypothetical protein [Flavobacteriales bacterium]
MKKQILKLTMIALFSSAIFVSCSSEQSSESTEQVVEAAYYCPMKCEGDKTYKEEGSCPVCGMDLVEKE